MYNNTHGESPEPHCNEEQINSPTHTHIYTHTPPHSLLTLHTLLLHGDRLGQIARTVHVAALEDSHVVGEELEGDDGKESL